MAQSEDVTEIAIYRIFNEENKDFENLLINFRNQLSALTGLDSYTTLKDLHIPNVYIDIVNWNDIHLALAASDSVKFQEKYKPFTLAIDSLLAYGEYYQFKQFSNFKSQTNMTNNITEVVIYKIKSDKISDYNDIAENTNRFLMTQKGFIGRKILQDHKDKSIFLDFVEWETLADAEATMEKSQQEVTLIPFFESTEKVITFSHYTFFK